MTVEPGNAVRLVEGMTLAEHRDKHADPRQRPETQAVISARISDFRAAPDISSVTAFGVRIILRGEST